MSPASLNIHSLGSEVAEKLKMRGVTPATCERTASHTAGCVRYTVFIITPHSLLAASMWGCFVTVQLAVAVVCWH